MNEIMTQSPLGSITGLLSFAKLDLFGGVGGELTGVGNRKDKSQETGFSLAVRDKDGRLHQEAMNKLEIERRTGVSSEECGEDSFMIT